MHLGRNYLYLSIAELASKVITFAAIAYLARVVGPMSYGYFEFAAAALFCAGLIVDQGLGPYGAREIAKRPESTPQLVWQIVSLRFALAFFALLTLVLFALAIKHPPQVTQLLIIYALDLMLMPLLLQWVFQGYEQMGSVAVLQLIRQTLFAFVILLFVHESNQIWIVGLAEAAGIAGAAIYGCVKCFREVPQLVRVHLHLSWRVLQESAPIGLSQVFWVVRMYGATLILGLIAASQEVGYFGAAMRIFVALHAFIYLYFFNQLPSMVRAWHASDASLNQLIAQSFQRVAWACLFAVPIWVIAAPAVMRAAYGAEFIPGSSILQWLAVVFAVTWLDGHYRFSLIAAGFQHLEMYSQLLGSLAVIILIPTLYSVGGLNLVGIALISGELVVAAVTWWYSIRKLALHAQIGLLARLALGAGLILLLLWITFDLALLERILIMESVLGLVVVLTDSKLRTALLTLVQRKNVILRTHLDRLARLRSN